jgi:hypothetical protein
MRARVPAVEAGAQRSLETKLAAQGGLLAANFVGEGRLEQWGVFSQNISESR